MRDIMRLGGACSVQEGVYNICDGRFVTLAARHIEEKGGIPRD